MKNVKIATESNDNYFFEEFSESVNAAYKKWMKKVIEPDEGCVDGERILELPEHVFFKENCDSDDAWDVLENEFPEHYEAYGNAVTCCGIADEVIEVDGKMYFFGCNFGH